MNKPTKIYWRLRNIVQAFYLYHFEKGNSGLLTPRENNKDKPYLGIYAAVPKFDELSLIHNPDWVFNQDFLNICVFAGGVMGLSHQTKKRFSIKFAVKLAKKLGYITKNGYSFQKAILKIVTKYGLLPYEDMPDEINGSWEEYSKYDVTKEQFKKAAQYKFPAYRRLTGIGEVITALEEGLVIHTANMWWTDMNTPNPPDYYLKVGGHKVGGHAWCVPGYGRKDTSLKYNQMLNSYGKRYADNGTARIEDIFNNNQYPVYVVEKLPELPKFNTAEIQKLRDKGKKYILLVEDYKGFTRGLWKLVYNGLIKIESKDVPEKDRNDAFIIQSADNGTLTPYSSADFAKFVN